MMLSLAAARRAVAWAKFQMKCFTSLWRLVPGCSNTVAISVSIFQAGELFLLRTEITRERIFMWGCLFVFHVKLFNCKKCIGNYIS